MVSMPSESATRRPRRAAPCALRAYSGRTSPAWIDRITPCSSRPASTKSTAASLVVSTSRPSTRTTARPRRSSASWRWCRHTAAAIGSGRAERYDLRVTTIFRPEDCKPAPRGASRGTSGLCTDVRARRNSVARSVPSRISSRPVRGTLGQPSKHRQQRRWGACPARCPRRGGLHPERGKSTHVVLVRTHQFVSS
jgi:hypothetical protein